MRRVLVTGGSGFIGSNLVTRLLSRGDEVYYTGNRAKIDPGGVCLGYAFDDLDWARLGRFDVVFHQAAITDTLILDRELMDRVNRRAALELFDRATEHGCRRIVYASSCAIYGNGPVPFREADPPQPLNTYAESKAHLDEDAGRFAKLRGLSCVGLRYSNVYGKNEHYKGRSASMVHQTAMRMLRGDRPILFKWGEQQRDFVYIDDVVEANILASEVEGCTVVNIGAGKPTNFNHVVEVINTIIENELDIDYIDNHHLTNYQNLTMLDLTRATTVLGYRPKWGIEDGIREYLVHLAVGVS